jgi:hypothetical protein
MTDAGVSMTSGTFINYLNTGQAGYFASVLAGYNNTGSYLCNLIGSTNFSPCAGYAGHGYPINFFQANPYNAGKATGYQTDSGYGNYHALQVDFRQKPWHGAQFDVNWTWSHSLGVQPSGSWIGDVGLFTMRDLRLNYAPAAFDYRHVIHGNGTYDLPFGKGRRFANQGGIVDKIVGGWTIGTVLNYLTGAPFMLTSGYRTANGPICVDGVTFCTATMADGGVYLKGITTTDLASAITVRPVPGQTFSNTIDPTYLTSQTNGTANATYLGPNSTAGTVGYHPWLYGPHQFTQDLAITKSIPIHENVRFSFQGEFINVWNHPVWGTPTASVVSSSFGHTSAPSAAAGAAGGPRLVELRANFEF